MTPPATTRTLAGHNCIVTGAGRGIGRAEALALAAHGADVLCVDVAAAEATAAVIRATGANAHYWQGDLTVSGAAEEILCTALEAFGDVTALVNNAGAIRDRMVFNLTGDDWDLVLVVNLTTPFKLSRALAQHWRRTTPTLRRRIINTSSESGLYRESGYCGPHPHPRRRTRPNGGERQRNSPPRPHPHGRGLLHPPRRYQQYSRDRRSPEHVASFVMWLLSPAAETVTGQIFVVSGHAIQWMHGWTHATRPWRAPTPATSCGPSSAAPTPTTVPAPSAGCSPTTPPEAPVPSNETPELNLDGIAARYSMPLNLVDVLWDHHSGAGRVALIWENATDRGDLTFDELRARSISLATVLAEQGIRAGDRAAVLLPRSPQLLIAVLSIWRLGAVQVPLFTAFGPDSVTYRVTHAEATAIITDEDNRAKIEDNIVRTVVCVGHGRGGDIDFDAAVRTQNATVAPLISDPDDPFILLYTSGTTGKPKGVPIPVRALASFHSYMRFALKLTDPADTLRAIDRLRITNLTGAPTFYRSLRKHDIAPTFRRTSTLRALSSAGEPLSPDLLSWSEQTLGVAIHDHYGQSEIGMAVGFPTTPTWPCRPEPRPWASHCPDIAWSSSMPMARKPRSVPQANSPSTRRRLRCGGFPAISGRLSSPPSGSPPALATTSPGDTAIFEEDGAFSSACRVTT